MCDVFSLLDKGVALKIVNIDYSIYVMINDRKYKEDQTGPRDYYLQM